ncbi:ABSCISIC ACID-INSENSITIVE 5-like protein 2 [Ancistrocladus abbreviatus]
MGTQTMGSQGVDNNASVSKPPSLCGQGSLYSLTFDEVQTHLGNLGKPLSSMNLDELLRTVCTVEATQLAGIVTNGASVPVQFSSGSSLSRQSSISLSRDLSKKTVDEVWKEIQEGKKRNSAAAGQETYQERQHGLGEVTLEDFLVQAGVVEGPAFGGGNNAGHDLAIDSIFGRESSIPHHAQWMQCHLIPHQQQHSMMAIFMPGHHVQQPTAGAFPDLAQTETQMAMSPSGLVGTSSDSQMPGRKRVAPGDLVEKTVERRQKRMIKNRESAARSRARKQAYTHELENKVSRLEAENKRLKELKEVEKVLPCVPLPEPKYQLRRTSSAPV